MKKREEFEDIIKDIKENETVNLMKNYRQHFNTSCYEHCYNASYYCFLIAKKLHWDYISVARAAMLHDLFLYDWRKRSNNRKRFHAFRHGNIACQNACKLFDLTEKEKNIIKRHMFPVTPIPPNSKEGLLLTLIDKYCGLIEIKSKFKRNHEN